MEKHISTPEIIFESGWLLDSSLEELSKESLNQAAVDEVANRTSEFQDAWDQLGKPLIESALRETGLSFKERDIKGVLICGPIASQSHPLIINVKYFLKSLEEKPQSMTEFVDVVFHELLHVLLQDNVRTFPTPTAQEFIADEFDVIAHLHLMAIQKYSHEKIGNATERLGQWYQRIGRDYQRSWELVSDEAIFSKLMKEIGTEFGRVQH
ncbi:MAG: hypothetical protein J7501_18580 [Bdellovibrio sp.]|nr:hypothetical protein [Bdellovibrio sp.]